MAADVVRIFKPHSELDQRHGYNNAILSTALDKTVVTHGDYELATTLRGSQRDRALIELIDGRLVNTHMVPTRREWESKTLPIRIPIAKGLLGYRLFLIKRQDLDRFADIRSLQELKMLKAGLRQQWSTALAMQALGCEVITGSSYEGLFQMLVHGRFDYLPRGVNEIFSEYDRRHQDLPDMVIEPRKALYLPMPTYIFVSPQYPELAERLEAGLHKMIHDGSLDKLFWKYHRESIQRSELTRRQIFTTENPLLSPETPLDQKELWFDPLAPPPGSHNCTVPGLYAAVSEALLRRVGASRWPFRHLRWVDAPSIALAQWGMSLKRPISGLLILQVVSR